MGLTSLANAPSLANAAHRRSRRDASSIDALFEEGLAGIDEESPLEEPSTNDTDSDSSFWSKQREKLNLRSPEKQKAVDDASESQATDEDSFKRKWKENQDDGIKKWASLDTLFPSIPSEAAWKNETIRHEKKSDDWGEAGDILLMLPDGGEGAGHSNAEVKDKRPSIMQKKQLCSERIPESSFEFGEYLPSCLSGGRRTPTAGRRRLSPTSLAMTSANLISTSGSVNSTSGNLTSTSISLSSASAANSIPSSASVTPTFGNDKDNEATACGMKQSDMSKPSTPVEFSPRELKASRARPRRSSPASNVQESRRVEFSVPGVSEKPSPDKVPEKVTDKESSDNSLLERLRQTLLAKSMVENEKNQFCGELKQVKEENRLLKDEILKVEKEKLNVEKQLSDLELSSSSAICKTFSEEKDEAQKIAVQLSSEIQLLKNTCALAEERISSLQRVYQQEVDMLKEFHSRELEAKEKQLFSERSFMENQKHATETLAELASKSNDWCKKVEELQHSVVIDRDNAVKSTREWLNKLESTASDQHLFMNECRKRSDMMQKQLEEITAKLSQGVRDIKHLQTTERERINEERANLQAHQEALQIERVQSLTEVGSARQKLDEVREMYLQEKEAFLQRCFEEKKEISGERDTVLRMKEQLYHADAALEKQLLEHAARIQNETGELSKQRSELEKARAIAADIAQEVEDGRRELEFRYQKAEKSKRFCDTDESTTESEMKHLRHKSRQKHQRVYESADFTQNSTTPLFRLIQHSACHYHRKPKKKSRSVVIAGPSTSNNVESPEVFSRLKDQREFLEEAKKNLQATKQLVRHILPVNK